jgi:uncharacterized DUF497 family protein
MKIVWDEAKRQRNIKVHGYDLAGSVDFEWADALMIQSYPSARGRPRFTATGFLKEDLVTLVFSPLGSESLSVISLRRASRGERKAYDAV